MKRPGNRTTRSTGFAGAREPIPGSFSMPPAVGVSLRVVVSWLCEWHLGRSHFNPMFLHERMDAYESPWCRDGRRRNSEGASEKKK